MMLWCPSLRSRLLGMFLKGESDGDEGDDMEHFANVMTNVTQVVEGRTFLLDPGQQQAARLCRPPPPCVVCKVVIFFGVLLWGSWRP